MSGVGFILPAAVIGLGSLYIKPQRGFYPVAADGEQAQEPIKAQVTIEEVHHDELEITDHPVERGAVISDHAFKRPAECIIRCSWSNSPSTPGGIIGAAVGVASVLGGSVAAIAAAAGPTAVAAGSLLSGNAPSQATDIYNKLLALQVSGVPFDVYTGKRKYTDMLFRSLSVTTDQKNENNLMLTATVRQVLIVSTTTVTVPINSSELGLPTQTTPVQDAGQQTLQTAPSYVP